MIRFVRAVERDMPMQHPVGMTFQYAGGSNETLMASPADWISPNPKGGYQENPPAADGTKVIITDTDHLWGLGGNRLWVWKSFIRGMNPIYMEDTKGNEVDNRAIREALGHTRAMALKLDLARTTPQNELASTGYCLADVGTDYVALQPETGPLTVTLPDAEQRYQIEWFDIDRGQSVAGGTVKAAGAISFKPPFDGPAVLRVTRLR